jgi:hypothetical protein
MSKTAMKLVIRSGDLSKYKMTKAMQAVLDKQDKLDQYMQTAGIKRAPYIRLFRHDYSMMDKAVRAQSEGDYNITKVLFRGRKIIADGDSEPVFTLEAQT